MVKIYEFNNSTKKYNFDNLSKEDCILICQTIKIGKDKVKNPLTNNNINYNSHIVKQILQLCYTKYNMKKRVNEIVDIDVLFDKKTLIKSKSGGGIFATVSAVYQLAKKTCTTAMYAMSYEDIYKEIESLGDSPIENPILLDQIVCFTLSTVDKLELFKNFIQSCNNIKSKDSITFDELKSHIDCIVQIFSVLSKYIKNYEKNIVFYNDSFISTYNEYVSEYDNIYPNTTYMGLIRHYGEIQSNTEKFNELTLTLINSKLNTYNKRLNGFHKDAQPIDAMYYDIFSKIYLFKDYYKKSKEELKYLLFSTNKYLPKYFAYAHKITHPGHHNGINYIIAFLNYFSKDISSTIVIENPIYISKGISVKTPEITNEIIKNKSLIMKSYGNNENLLSILYDNKYSDNHYIYINNFKGTYYTSVIDKYVLIYKLQDIQYYNMIPDKISIIEGNYKNFGNYPYSTNVNKALSLLSRGYSFVLDIPVKDRINKIFTNIINSSSKNSDEQILYVFHGTNSLLSNELQDELVLTSLLSTSLNINTAITYGKNIYVFRIKSNTTHYINFNDDMYQLLLLPGSKITILNTFKVLDKYDILLCDIENTLDNNYYKNILQQMKSPDASKLFTYNENSIKVSLKTFNINIDATDKRKNETSIDVRAKYETSHFTCYNLFLEASEERLLRFSFCNLKYTYHQMIINYIYTKINSDYVVKYNLMNCKNGEILICFDNNNSRYNTQYDKYNFNLLIADLLCGADVINRAYYTKDYIYKDNKFMRSLFKATGIYDGNGIQTFYKKDYSNKNIQKILHKYIEDFCNSDQLYLNINPAEFEQITTIIMNDINNNLNFDLKDIIKDIKDIIDKSSSIITDNETIELNELEETMIKYFNVRKTFIMKNIGKIIDIIKNKLSNKQGGKPMRTLKENERFDPYQSKSKKAMQSADKVLNKKAMKSADKVLNNNVTYINGNEIARKGYSSITTLSIETFNDIQKRYNPTNPMYISSSMDTSKSSKSSKSSMNISSNSSDMMD